MANLLLDDYPLVVIPALAEAVGLNQAIVLQQLHYWLQKSEHEHDGRTWIYNTYKQWQAQFPFWSVRTVRRILKKLEDAGLVIVGNYNQKAYDRTKWYSLDYDRLAKLTNGSSKPTGQIGHIDADKLDAPIPETTQETTKTDTTTLSATPTAPKSHPIKDLLTGCEGIWGYKTPNGGKEAKAAKKLLQRHSEKAILLCLSYVMTDPFYGDKHVSLQIVVERIGPWLKLGGPARVVKRGNGNGGDARRDPQLRGAGRADPGAEAGSDWDRQYQAHIARITAKQAGRA